MELRKTSYGAGFIWGVAGAAAMSALLATSRAIGISDFSLERLLGALATGSGGVSAWMLGFTVHLAVGGLFGLSYARAFHFAGRTGARFGAMFGFAHWIFAGVILGLLPPSGPSSPGFFLMNASPITALQFLALHIFFGAAVGAGHSRAMAVAIAQRLPVRAPQRRAA